MTRHALLPSTTLLPSLWRATMRAAAGLAAVAVLAAPARSQTAERVNAPFAVEAVLAPLDLVAALAGVCGEACVEVVEEPAGWGGSSQLATAVAAPPDGPTVTARAWRPDAAFGTPAAPDVPERAVASLWRGGQRRDWEVFGRHSASVELAPGRTLEAGPAASRAALDAALEAVRTDLLTQPPRRALVVPGTVRLWFTPAEADEAARRARPRITARVPVETLRAALPRADTLNARVVAAAAPFDGVLAHIAVLAVYPDGYAEQYMVAGPPPRAQLLLVSTDAVPDTLARPARVRGYPARVYATEQPDLAYYVSVVSDGSARPQQPLVRAVDVLVAPGRIARVVGPDTLLADRLLAAADLAALAGPVTARVIESPELTYARAATPYRGLYADERSPGTIVTVQDGVPPLWFTLPADRYAVGVPAYCEGGAGIALAVVAAEPVAPCAGLSAEAYPDSEAARLARAGGLAVVHDHGASGAVRLAWAAAWPAYRRALLPAWAIPLEPSGAPERVRVGGYDALAYAATSAGGRVPGDAFAAYALLIDLDGRLVSVVGADASTERARERAETLAATLSPAPP